MNRFLTALGAWLLVIAAAVAIGLAVIGYWWLEDHRLDMARGIVIGLLPAVLFKLAKTMKGDN
jgi:hypothetical protein